MNQPTHRAYIAWAIVVTVAILAIIGAWAMGYLSGLRAFLGVLLVAVGAALIIVATERGR